MNDLERPVGTYLYGRRMYETMAVWETMALDDEPPVMRDFAGIWRAADKVVYSTTLADVSTRRTRLERDFDADAVREMKAGAARDIGVGGAELAAAGAPRPGSSTSSTSSWRPSSSAAARAAAGEDRGWISTCARSGGSATARSTCVTRLVRDLLAVDVGVQAGAHEELQPAGIERIVEIEVQRRVRAAGERQPVRSS